MKGKLEEMLSIPCERESLAGEVVGEKKQDYGLWEIGQRMESNRGVQRKWKLPESYNPKD